MGEIAEAMLNGDLCEHCGSWVGPGQGFPVSCCVEGNEKPTKKPGIQPSPHEQKRKNKMRKIKIKKFFREVEADFDIHFEMVEIMKQMNRNALLQSILESPVMKGKFYKHICQQEERLGKDWHKLQEDSDADGDY